MAKNEATEMSWAALAYIDAGIFLTKSILDKEFEGDGYKPQVPIFLLHQGLELLFKAAITSKVDAYPKTHDLHVLKKEFDDLFPDLYFEISDSILGFTKMNQDLFPNIALSKVIQHERLRYPTDKSGEFWRTDDKIDLHELYEEILFLNGKSVMVWQRINEISNTA